MSAHAPTPKYVLSGARLTVIIRDDTPLIHMGEPVSLRTVQFDLTLEQCASLKMYPWEDLSTAILEIVKTDVQP